MLCLEWFHSYEQNYQRVRNTFSGYDSWKTSSVSCFFKQTWFLFFNEVRLPSDCSLRHFDVSAGCLPNQGNQGKVRELNYLSKNHVHLSRIIWPLFLVMNIPFFHYIGASRKVTACGTAPIYATTYTGCPCNPRKTLVWPCCMKTLFYVK